MRALSACLVAVLALSAAVVTACSSTSSDDSSSGGTGGSTAGTTSTAGTGGKEAGGTGGSGTAGTSTGAAGDSGCPALDGPCGTCVGDMCQTEETDCQKDNACSAALSGFILCACTPDMTIPQCAGSSLSGGDAATTAVGTCAQSKCKTECGF